MSELWRWMRFPSDEAVRARPDQSPWLMKEQTGWIHMVGPVLPRPPWHLIEFYMRNGIMDRAQKTMHWWWPCDADGVRVPWPTDENGDML